MPIDQKRPIPKPLRLFEVRRAFQEAEERLKKRGGQTIRAGRFSLVNAMASPLAHEINQPTIAARVLGPVFS
jgi:C4-dicarboxylate-specific signal transduction histidine kinase